MEELISFKDAAKTLSVTVRTILNYCEKGYLEKRKPSHKSYVTKDSLQKYMKNNEK